MMNIKQVASVSVVFSAAMAFGAAVDVAADSGETLGIVQVARPTKASTEIVIGVPFLKSPTNAEMTVSHVLVQGYEEDDALYFWNEAASRYEGWSWVWGELSPMLNKWGYSPNPSAQETSRGKAVWFRGATVSTNRLSVAGLVKPGVKTAVVAGTTAAPKQTLLVNPFGTAVGLDDILTSGMAVGDQIALVNSSVRYEYNTQVSTSTQGWGTWERSKKVVKGKVIYGAPVFTIAEPIEIPAGQAFWYISVGGSPLVNWD